MKLTSRHSAKKNSGQPCMNPENLIAILTRRILSDVQQHINPSRIISVKSSMTQSTGTNSIDRDQYNTQFDLNNGPAPRCAQLMLWSGDRR